MARFDPFEPASRLAVAVSGGPDSMALCLLADRWARARGGSVLALTVDHGIRAASAAEAQAVAGWLATRGIDHRILPLEIDLDGSGARLQERARAARYDRLERCCADAGILHLLTAHTRDDQAETVLLRFAKGSGIDGLAGMPAVTERAAIRVLRPLLDWPKRDLAATCVAARQAWVIDPSNRSRRFARGRLRHAVDALAAEGYTPERAANLAQRAGLARQALDAATADLLAAAAAVHAEGYVDLDRRPIAAAPTEIALRGIAACLRIVGGGTYGPRFERLQALLAAIETGGLTGRTLAGCRIIPLAGERIRFVREASAATQVIEARPGDTLIWDGRFAVTVPGGLAADGLVTVARLGPGRQRRTAVPAAAIAALPALWSAGRIAALPEPAVGHLRSGKAGLATFPAAFAPAQPLAAAPFGVVWPLLPIIS